MSPPGGTCFKKWLQLLFPVTHALPRSLSPLPHQQVESISSLDLGRVFMIATEQNMADVMLCDPPS